MPKKLTPADKAMLRHASRMTGLSESILRQTLSGEMPALSERSCRRLEYAAHMADPTGAKGMIDNLRKAIPSFPWKDASPKP